MRLLAPAAVLLLLAVFDSARAASFPCERARARAADERAVCADRALNDQDVRVATLFDFLRGVHAMGGRDALRDRQREWLGERRRCGGDRACLARAYRARVAELQADYDHLPRPF